VLQFCNLAERSETTDSLEWSKQYTVFSVSRLDLLHQLGFSHDQISRLSDTDMQILVEKVREAYGYLENDFGETVRFVTTIVLAEKEKEGDETLDRGA
jgi:hypothetical protein